MPNSNSEVIFQEQKLDCATNMVKRYRPGKLKLLRKDFVGFFLTVAPYFGHFGLQRIGEPLTKRNLVINVHKYGATVKKKFKREIF